MVSDRELIDIVIRLLNNHGDKQDIEQLHNWKQTSCDRNVNQQAKYIINIGEAQGIKIGDSLDTELLEEIRDLLRSQSVTPDLDIDWQEISQAMLEEYQRLTTNPLTAGEGVFHSSNHVYVPLGLVERKRKARHSEDVSPEKGSELYQETEIIQRFENEEFLEQVLKLGKSPKSKGKHIAIIGEPGAGKTTLLQQIAQWITKQLDDAIVIWVSLADLRGQELEIYLLERWLQAVTRRLGQAEVTPQVKDAFVAQFQRRQVWLLLDGVDEMQVTSVNPLSEISQQVRMGGLLSQAKIVLTCRINLWDGNVNTLDTFDTYRTLEFSYPQQVEHFIGNWFSFLSSEEKLTRQNLCNALKEQGKERIRDLAKNPLRLTLLCFNWYLGNGKLPETKAGLYEQFVDDFYEWKREQFTTTGEQRKQLNTALGELAREAIDRDKARFQLRQDFVCEYLGAPDNEDSLFSLALRLGWLNRVGVDGDNSKKKIYTFFHPTFQEYFAALAIDNWHYFLNHVPKKPNHPDASYLIFKSQWKEIILLWLGRKNIRKERKQSFIKALIKFKDNVNSYFEYRAFLLACEGICEYTETLLVKQRIVSKLVKYSFGFNHQPNNSFFPRWIRYISYIEEEARNVLFRTDINLVIESLEKLLQTSIVQSSKEFKYDVTKVLGELDPNNAYLISMLMYSAHYLTTGDPVLDRDYRHMFQNILGEMGKNNKKVTISVVDFIDNCQKPEFIQKSIIKVENKTNFSHRLFIESICQKLELELVRRTCKTLGYIGEESPIVIDTLLKVIIKYDDNGILFRAFESLRKIGRQNPDIHQKLAQLNTDNERKQSYIIDFFMNIDSVKELLIKRLSDFIKESNNERIIFDAAIKLHQIDRANSIATYNLSKILKESSNEWIVRKALLELCKVKKYNLEVINFLNHNICNPSNKSYYTNYNSLVIEIIKQLDEIANYNITIVESLEKIIKNNLDKNTIFRLLEYNYERNFDNRNDVINLIVEKKYLDLIDNIDFSYDKNDDIYKLLPILVKEKKYHSKVIDYLLGYLQYIYHINSFDSKYKIQHIISNLNKISSDKTIIYRIGKKLIINDIHNNNFSNTNLYVLWSELKKINYNNLFEIEQKQILIDGVLDNIGRINNQFKIDQIIQDFNLIVDFDDIQTILPVLKQKIFNLDKQKLQISKCKPSSYKNIWQLENEYREICDVQKILYCTINEYSRTLDYSSFYRAYLSK